MLARIKSLLFDEAADAESASDDDSDGSLAVALMIQAALADGEFSADERGVIERVLMRDHGATEAEAEALIDTVEANVRDSVQMFGFTSAVNQALDFDRKVALMETLWEVILADGVIDSHEAVLMRRLAGLLHVPDHDSALARQRVQSRLAQT